LVQDSQEVCQGISPRNFHLENSINSKKSLGSENDFVTPKTHEKYSSKCTENKKASTTERIENEHATSSKHVENIIVSKLFETKNISPPNH